MTRIQAERIGYNKAIKNLIMAYKKSKPHFKKEYHWILDTLIYHLEWYLKNNKP